MKKLLFALLVAFTANTAIAQKAPPRANTPPQSPNAVPAGGVISLPIGSVIPNEGVLMQSVDETPVTLRDALTSKGLLVMFSCNTCPYVIKGQPRTTEAQILAQKYGIGMVIINSNEAQRDDADAYEAMKIYAKSQNYRVPYVRDDNSMMADAFGATRTPEVFLFNGEGKLVYKGAMEDNPSEPEKSKEYYLANAIRALSENRPIKTATTKSIGCSIKRRS
jgi:thioredoxin-related protein